MAQSKTPRKEESAADRVRAYMTKHPKATATEVAAATDVQPAYVYVLRSKQRKKAAAKADGAKALEAVKAAPAKRSNDLEYVEEKLSPEEYKGFLKGNLLLQLRHQGHAIA